jgi:hypothetical protein
LAWCGPASRPVGSSGQHGARDVVGGVGGGGWGVGGSPGHPDIVGVGVEGISILD